MRTNSIASVAVLLAGLLLQACAPGGTAGGVTNDRAAIEQIRKQITDAENTGDASVFGQVAAENVVVMPPNTSPISGRAAAVTAMGDFFRRFDMRIEYASKEIEVHGDLAFDRGTYSQAITPKGGGASMKETGNYLWLYRRGPEGKWEQTRAIWNADQRPPGTPQ